MRNINSIIVHCTATPLKTSVESIRNYHLSEGYKDIAYHYLIDRFGFIHDGRDLAIVGAHCKGFNQHSIGIALIGGKDRFDFTFKQLESLQSLISRLMEKYNIPKEKVSSHYEYNKNKKCPQFNVKNLLFYED